MTLWEDEHPRPPVDLAGLVATVVRVGCLWTMCAALGFWTVAAMLGVW